MADNDLPVVGSLVPDSIKEEFNTLMRQLTSDIGRTITIDLPPLTVSCPNCRWNHIEKRSAGIYTANASGILYNIPFTIGQTCPVCQGAGQLPFHRTDSFKCLINRTIVSRNNNDFNFSNLGADPTNVVRTKCTNIHTDNLKLCRTAIIDGERYQKITPPVPCAMSDPTNNDNNLQFVVVFWKRIE